MTLGRRLGISIAAILVLLAADAGVQVWTSRERDATVRAIETARTDAQTQAAWGRLRALESRAGRTQLTLHAATALVVLLGAGAGLRRLSAGFRALRRGASAISGDDLHAPLRLEGNDEFAELAGVINTLSYDLALTQRHLTMANRELEKRNREIDEQRRISESLLRNILPGEVADELSAKGEVQPKVFEDVTIVFTDFVGFTRSTEHMPARELVKILHDYFTDFDHIARRYRLEKLKTIGDSYMCVGGLPAPNASHPVDAVLAALEMLESVRGRTVSERGWDVRIGIHTGSVIAGVVGIDKFAFDVWGETVNFSSRVEATGSPNRINLSSVTSERTAEFFELEPRGKVRTKENREYDMYFVAGIRRELMDDPAQSPPPGFVRRYRALFRTDPPAFPGFLQRRGDFA